MKVNAYRNNDRPLLSLYLTAGFPDVNISQRVVQQLLDNPDVDMIELGMPYSDPMADGPVIQHTSQVALQSGMTIRKYFDLLKTLDNHRGVPMLFMGYFNNVLKFGVAKFLEACQTVGIDSTIIPDLPVDVFETEYREIFDNCDMGINCLVCPSSTDQAIKQAHNTSHRFLYLVSAGSTTGRQPPDHGAIVRYLQRIVSMGLSKPRFVGFGIGNHAQFSMVTKYADGAIIGSALLNHLEVSHFDKQALQTFIQTIRYDHTT